MFTTLAAILLAVPAAPPDTTIKQKPPTVKLLSVAKDGMLTFEVTNPNAEALHYVGYSPGSFQTPPKEGTIAPLYNVELLRGKEWKDHDMGWCHEGKGKVSVPAKGKVTFMVDPPDGDWHKLRIGLTWFKNADRKEREDAWSDALGKDDITPKKP